MTAKPDPRLVEAMAEAMHDAPLTQHWVTHEMTLDGDDMEGVECIGGAAEHREDADDILSAFLSDPRTVAWLAERLHDDMSTCLYPLAEAGPTRLADQRAHEGQARAILGVEP